MATITIKGVDKLRRKLTRTASIETLRDPMNRGVLRLQRDMAEYPPKPTGSTYIRTGTLGRRWTTRVQRSGNGLVGRVGNNTAYAPWVQSDRFQAWMHKGRWQTDQDVVDRNRRAIVADFQRAIDKALRD